MNSQLRSKTVPTGSLEGARARRTPPEVQITQNYSKVKRHCRKIHAGGYTSATKTQLPDKDLRCNGQTGGGASTLELIQIARNLNGE